MFIAFAMVFVIFLQVVNSWELRNGRSADGHAPPEVGIFGGSFNPIHIGHLALANYLCEFGGLDAVWFLVTPQNPLKQHDDLLDDHCRLELARLATQGYDKFYVSDFEFHQPRPSYTVHTLQALKRAYPENEFHLIIGSDNWKVFNLWFNPQRLIAENKLIIYPRPVLTSTRKSFRPRCGWSRLLCSMSVRLHP